MSKYKCDKDKSSKKTTNQRKKVNNLYPDGDLSTNSLSKVESNKINKEKESIYLSDSDTSNYSSSEFSSSYDSDNDFDDRIEVLDNNLKFINSFKIGGLNFATQPKNNNEIDLLTEIQALDLERDLIVHTPEPELKLEINTNKPLTDSIVFHDVQNAIHYIESKPTTKMSNGKTAKQVILESQTRLIVRPIDANEINECIENENQVIKNININFSFPIPDKEVSTAKRIDEKNPKKTKTIYYYNYGFNRKTHKFLDFIDYFDKIEIPDDPKPYEKYLTNHLKTNPLGESSFVVSYEYSSENDRKYLLFSDPIQYLMIISRIPIEYICFHEIILGNRNQKIKFDIEAKLKDYPYLNLDNWNDSIDSFVGEVIIPVFYREYGIYLDFENDIIIDSSTDPQEKFSVHIIIDNYKVSSNVQATEFSKKVFAECDSESDFFIWLDKDVNKNNQSFRLRHSIKREAPNRRKEPFHQNKTKTFLNSLIYYTEYCKPLNDLVTVDLIHQLKSKRVTVSDPVIEECLDILEKKVHTRFTVRDSDLGKDKIHLDHDGAIACPICEINHDGDNPYLKITKNKNIYYVCHRAPTYGKQYPNDRIQLIKSKPETIPEDERIIKNIPVQPESDISCVNHSQPNVPYKWKPFDHIKLFQSFGGNYQPHSEHTIVDGDVRGILKPYHECRTLAIRAPMGCGKTKELVNFLASQLAKYGEKFRILLVSMRITLAYDQSKKLKDLGFVLYLEEKGRDWRFNRMICSPESMHKLHVDCYDLVILDESESIFAQLDSKTMTSGNLHHSLAIFYHNIKHTKQVIALDAFLGERTVNLLLRYRHMDINTNKIDKSDFYIQHNKIKLNTKDTFYCYSDLVLWDGQLNRAIENNEKVVICSFKSAKKTTLEAMRIGHLYPNLNIKCFTKLTKASEKRNAFLNFNNEVVNVDVLIYTSTLDVGVSVEIKRFDKCFIFIEPACQTTVEHVLQMCRRVRNFACHKYYVYMNYKWNNIPESISAIESMIQINHHLTVTLSGVNKDIFNQPHEIDENGNFIYHKSDYYYTKLYNLRDKILSKNHFKDLFEYQVKELGAKIEFQESDTEKLRNIKRAIKANKNVTLEELGYNEFILERIVDGAELEKQFRAELKAERSGYYERYCDEVAESEPLTEKEVEIINKKIRNNQDVEPSEQLSMDKHVLSKIYDEPIEDIDSGALVKLLSDPKYKKHYLNLIEMKDCDTKSKINSKIKQMAKAKVNRFEISNTSINDHEDDENDNLDLDDLVDDLRNARLIKLAESESKKTKTELTDKELYSQCVADLKDKYKYDYKAFLDFNCKDNFIRHYICNKLVNFCGFDTIWDSKIIKIEELEQNIKKNLEELEDWLNFIGYIFQHRKSKRKIKEWTLKARIEYINGIINSMYGCSIKSTRRINIKGKKNVCTDYKIKHTIEFVPTIIL